MLMGKLIRDAVDTESYALHQCRPSGKNLRFDAHCPRRQSQESGQGRDSLLAEAADLRVEMRTE